MSIKIKDNRGKFAEWLLDVDGKHYCSRCDETPYGNVVTKYCPNCGAKMVIPNNKVNILDRNNALNFFGKFAFA